MSSNYCVVCGAEIPEGWQVCSLCESKVKEAMLICSEERGDTPCMSCPLFMTAACKETDIKFDGLAEHARKEKKKMSMYIFPIALIVLCVTF